MILVEKHIIDINHPYYKECDKLCFLSKNLYNYANYLVRQEFIRTSKLKEEGKVEHATYLNYNKIRKEVIRQIDYVSLPRKVSNQTLMLLDTNWTSFFAANRDYRSNPSKYSGRPKLPKYKNPKTGRFVIMYEKGAISIKELRNGIVKLSGTNIRISTKKENITQCRIVPGNNQYTIEILYKVQDVEVNEDNGRYCGIDLGVNNLATMVSNVEGFRPIIINGKPLKSINQFFNKQNAKIKSELEVRNKQKTSKKLRKLTNKRNNKVNDYLHNASRYIINHLISNKINTLVIGKNKNWKKEINIGSVNNQNFVDIPHAKFIDMLTYKCSLVGIKVVITEESYTSKCSFLDFEDLKKQENYVGKRVKRGLFISKNGILINADVNGAYNILRKVFPNIFINGIEGLTVNPVVVSQKWGISTKNSVV